ncbi:MAG TPA: hypothetical protein VGE01_15185 [Fimbriimonas sp.]
MNLSLRVACCFFAPALFGLLAAGSAPSQAAQGYRVTGILTAPPGTVVVLKERNNQEITVTAKTDGNLRLTQTPFVFPKEVPNGSIYSVSIHRAEANLVCAVTKNGEGMVDGASPVVYVVGDLSADLASRSTDDKTRGTFYETAAPAIGGKGGDDGRYVAFVSYAAGLDGSTGKKRQVFWRDRHTGVTKLISSSAAGGEGNGDSGAPAISADGRSVAFESYATNLVPIDTNNVRDVFVWNADTNTVTSVSDAPGGIEANAEAYEPTISGDGKLVAFTSSASSLTSDVDGTSQPNVFLKDLSSGSVTLISRDEKTRKAGGGSRPSMSEDGSRIAFYNYAPLLDTDKNGLWDIYLWERGGQKLKRLSMTSEGGERAQGDESASRIVRPAISGNGKFVTFATTAGNVVPYDNNKVQDVFIVDVDTLRISRLSLDNNAEEGDADTPVGQGEKASLSHDAKWIVFTTSSKRFGGGVVMKNLVTGEMRVVAPAPGTAVGRPEISREGGYVAFGTSEKLDPRFPSSGIFVRFIAGR